MPVTHRCTHCNSRHTRITKSKNIQRTQDLIVRTCRCLECGRLFSVELVESYRAQASAAAARAARSH